jgi:Zn-dependent oligopeptidase
METHCRTSGRELRTLYSRAASASVRLLGSHCPGIVQDTTLPAFDKIKAEHVVPGIRELLAQLNADIDALEQDVVPTWAGLVEPIERIFDRLERAWGAVSHLKVGRMSSQTRPLTPAFTAHV